MLTVLLLACAPEPAPEVVPNTVAEEVAPGPELARPKDAWIGKRVAEAEARLGSSEAGQRLWNAMQAHGGLVTWYSGGPLRFRFDYRPVSGKRPRDTQNLVDPWSARAVHTTPSGARFGWDGSEAWTLVPEGVDFAMNARFWSLTPYYFVAIPFVLADPGVQLALEGQATFGGEPYDLLRATFTDGTGDAPDDFYVLYLHPETHHVRAIRYVVSYPGFYPEGGHGAEKLMAYDGAQNVGGVQLPTGFRTFTFDGTKAGELVTEIGFENVAFDPAAPESAFAKPEGATVQEGW